MGAAAAVHHAQLGSAFNAQWWDVATEGMKSKIPMDKFERLMSRPHLSGAKNQHYVSRFYLAGFADDNLVSCLDRRTGKINARTPERTACTPHIYTFEDSQNRRRFDWEEMFSFYENEAAPIISKIAARNSIDLDERELLTAFITLAALRTPGAIEEAKTVHASFVKARTRAEFPDERRAMNVLRAVGLPGATQAQQAELAAAIVKMVHDDAYIVDVDHGFALSKSLSKFTIIANALLKRDWMVLYAPEDSEGFLTTDQPVVLTSVSTALMDEPLGYESAHAQILFPLAHNCALELTGDQGRSGRGEISLPNLRRFNATIASYCHRYVFGRQKAHLKAVADEIHLATKPWKPNFSVETRQCSNAQHIDVLVRRDGRSPLEK